jgi:hypothetical protein
MNAATFPAAKGNRMTRKSSIPLLPTVNDEKNEARRRCSLQHLQPYLYIPLHTHPQTHSFTNTRFTLPVAMLNLGPCSMLPPHLHPRATNYVVAMHGNTTTYMYEENGARLVTQVLIPGHGTIFPQGSMHMMMNTGT